MSHPPLVGYKHSHVGDVIVLHSLPTRKRVTTGPEFVEEKPTGFKPAGFLHFEGDRTYHQGKKEVCVVADRSPNDVVTSITTM